MVKRVNVGYMLKGFLCLMVGIVLFFEFKEIVRVNVKMCFLVMLFGSE